MSARRFKKTYSGSFQSKVIAELRVNRKKGSDDSAYSLPVSRDEAGIAELFAEALGVTAPTLVEQLMEAELARMLKLKRKGASFGEMNHFYSSVVELTETERKEIKKLVANYLPIELHDLQNNRLVDHASKNLGLQFNNYAAFRLANFDNKPVIEIIFYIDQSKGRHYSQAWLGIKGAPIKSISFTEVSDLNEHVAQVSMFANLFDLEFCHVGRRGLRYER